MRKVGSIPSRYQWAGRAIRWRVEESAGPRTVCIGGPETFTVLVPSFRQHSTVHQTTGVTPAKAMFGCELPTLLDRLVPTAESPIVTEKLPPNRQLQPGEEEMVRQFLKKPNWIPGTLVRPMGRRSWLVKCATDITSQHLNQIRKLRLEEGANNGAPATLTWDMGQDYEEQETTAPERQLDRTAPRRSNRTRRPPPQVPHHV